MYFSSPMRAVDREPGSLDTASPVMRSFEPAVEFDASATLTWHAGAALGVVESMNVTTWLYGTRPSSDSAAQVQPLEQLGGKGKGKRGGRDGCE